MPVSGGIAVRRVMLNLFLFQQFASVTPVHTHVLCFSSKIIVHIHEYDRESCTLLAPSMMSSQLVQQSESLSISYEFQNSGHAVHDSCMHVILVTISEKYFQTLYQVSLQIRSL